MEEINNLEKALEEFSIDKDQTYERSIIMPDRNRYNWWPFISISHKIPLNEYSFYWNKNTHLSMACAIGH